MGERGSPFLVVTKFVIGYIRNRRNNFRCIKNDVEYSAQVEVDRSKFDVRYGSNSFYGNLGDNAINDIFTLDIKLTLYRHVKMKRKVFLEIITMALPATFGTMTLNALNTIHENWENTPKMPVLFLGHGSPMNAVSENEFVQGFRTVSSEIETPKAIIVISAHWETRGTRVTAMENPQTIHDFGGFPKELYEIQYPAPGQPQLAKDIKSIATNTDVLLDEKWGLDHGAWTVIKHMYPKANIPVIQLSLDYYKNPIQHFELARQLYELRKKGILIIGSGNMVHNLKMVHWQKLNENFGYEWANEANEKMKQFILDKNHQALINYSKQGKAFELSIPTPEHYLPLLYTLSLQDNKDEVKIFNDEPVAGSLTMTSIKIGN